MVQVALVQYAIAWENPEENMARIQALLNGYSGPKPDIIILPETWPTGFTMSNTAWQAQEAGLSFMEKLADQFACHVIGGVASRSEESQENRCYLVSKDHRDHYIKNRTFNFNGEHLFFRAGNKPKTWTLEGMRFSPLICYDLRFPELARRVAKQSDALIYIANWPSVREHHWRSLAVARAIENQCYVITVNRIGKDGTGLDHPGASLVIDPLGQIILDAKDHSGVFSAALDPKKVGAVREKWPFLADM